MGRSAKGSVGKVMLAFCGDDSGNHGKGPFVVAGYLAKAPDWFWLESEWEKALKEYPEIGYFKMNECYRLKGEFEKMSRPEADDKLRKLISVVCKYNHRMIEISSIIDWDDYRSVIGDGPFKDMFHSPYFFCFHGVVSLTAKMVHNEKGNEMIHYTFDAQSNLNHDSAKQYYFIRDTDPNVVTKYMGGISHQSDADWKRLQIADLIAWHVRKSFAEPPKDGEQERSELLQLRQASSEQNAPSGIQLKSLTSLWMLKSG
jgi:Protein of unknown function (DUF3800)